MPKLGLWILNQDFNKHANQDLIHSFFFTIDYLKNFCMFLVCTVLYNLFLLIRHTYIQWISDKNTSDKTIFNFMEVLHLPHGQISVWEDIYSLSLQSIFLIKLYHNSNFDVLVNFDFVLSTSKISYAGSNFG